MRRRRREEEEEDVEEEGEEDEEEEEDDEEEPSLCLHLSHVACLAFVGSRELQSPGGPN